MFILNISGIQNVLKINKNVDIKLPNAVVEIKSHRKFIVKSKF